MADYQKDYIYCSPWQSVRSLDEQMERPESSVFSLVDTEDDPETALIRAEDSAVLDDWVGDLKPRDRDLLNGVFDGDLQSDIARRQGVTEPAVSKRLKKLRARGVVDLAPLRRSILLQ